MACALLVGLVCIAGHTPRARASDFWDTVRGGPRGSGATTEHIRRARAALASNRPDLAMQALGGEAEVAESPEGLLVLGRVHAGLGADREALRVFERALEALGGAPIADEEDASAVVRHALRASRIELALRAVVGRADAALTPVRRTPWLVLEGHLRLALGPQQLERALAAYRQALGATPDHAPALIGLALALHRQGSAASESAALAIARRVRDPVLADGTPLDAFLPRAERFARSALLRASIGDRAAAQAAWQSAASEPGPWQAHAQRALEQACGGACKSKPP
jgi:tetratricopeptide (TPR) repeat protein